MMKLKAFIFFAMISCGLFAESINSWDEFQHYIDKLTSVAFFETDSAKSPNTTWVIRGDELEKYPVVALKDLMDMVPGNVVGGHEFSGPLIGTRGILIDNNAKTLFLLDGQNINQRAIFGYEQALENPLIGDLKRVEVVHGPGSIVHGSGAINGFVQLERKTGEDQSQWKVGAEYGISDKMLKAEVSKGWVFGANHNFYLYFGVAQAEGTKPESNVYGYQLDRSDEYSSYRSTNEESSFRYNALPKPNYKLSSLYKFHNFQFNFLYQNTAYDTGSASTRYNHGTNIDKDTYAFHKMMALNLDYTISLAKNVSVDLSLPVSIFDQGIFENALGRLNPSNTATEYENIGGSEISYGFQSVLKIKDFNYQNIAIGSKIGKRKFKELDFTLMSDKIDEGHQTMQGQWSEISLFGEDSIDLNNDLSLALGARYDATIYDFLNYSKMDKEITPKSQDSFSVRASVAYKINEKDSTRFSYQQGFRDPDAASYSSRGFFSEKLVENGGIPFKDLEAETMDMYEISYKNNSISKYLGFELTAFYNIYSNMLHFHDYNLEPLERTESEVSAVVATEHWLGGVANDPDEFKSIGGEAVLNFHSRYFSGQVSYSYSRPLEMGVISNQSTELANDSRKEWAKFHTHLLKGHLNQRITDKFNYSLVAFYGSPVDKGNGEKTIFNHHRYKLSFKLNYSVSENLVANVIAKNVLQNKIPAPGYLDNAFQGQAGDDARLIYAGIEWTL